MVRLVPAADLVGVPPVGHLVCPDDCGMAPCSGFSRALLDWFGSSCCNGPETSSMLGWHSDRTPSMACASCHTFQLTIRVCEGHTCRLPSGGYNL